MSGGLASAKSGRAESERAESEAGESAGTVTPENRLAPYFDYYLRDGGIWRQENRGYEPGSGFPVAYLKVYRWGPGRAMVLDDTYAQMADGSCMAWTHNVFVWDHGESAVVGAIYHRAGMTFRGVVQLESGEKTVAEFSGHGPDGSEIVMRDVTDRSAPDRAAIVAYLQDEGTWRENPPVYWTRVEGDPPACLTSQPRP